MRDSQRESADPRSNSLLFNPCTRRVREMRNFSSTSPLYLTRLRREKMSALSRKNTNNASAAMPSNTLPALPINFVENMISEINSHSTPEVQAKALIALAALSLRVKLDPESFLRVVEPILDVLEKKNVGRDTDDAKNDDFEGVTAAALAALSCFLGNVERAHQEMAGNLTQRSENTHKSDLKSDGGE